VSIEENDKPLNTGFDWKRGIIAGVIAGFLVLVVLQPLYAVAWNFMVSSSNEIYSFFVDRIYKSAARDVNSGFIYYIFEITILAPSVIVTVMLFGSLSLFNKIENEKSK